MKKKLMVVSTVCIILVLLMAMTPVAALAADQSDGLPYQMDDSGPGNGGREYSHYSDGPCYRYGVLILP